MFGVAPASMTVRVYRTRSSFLDTLRQHRFNEQSIRFFAASGAPRPMRGQLYVPPEMAPHDVCHELAHAFIEAVSGKAYRTAKWLDEGFASFFAGKHCGGGAAPPRAKPSLTEMLTEKQWHDLARQRRMRRAYQRSWFVVGLLASRFGEARVVDSFRALQARGLDATLRGAFGIDTAGVEKMALAAVENIAKANASELKFLVDTGGIAAYVGCRKRGASEKRCRAASRHTLGGRIARASRPTFGPKDESFVAKGIEASTVARLVQKVLQWDLPAVAGQVQTYLPARVRATIRIFWVANGHRWGDAYVRRVRFGSDGAVVLAADGDPVIVLNALKIATEYGATADEQAQAVLGVVKHELFHVLFARYRRTTPAWSRLRAPNNDRIAELAVSVLNEGIAHFIHRRSVKPDQPAVPRDRATDAFGKLDRKVDALAAHENVDLLSAFQGSYWNKYGAISGMVIAETIYRVFDVEGIRRSIQCGPGALIKLYAEAVAGVPGHLPLGANVQRYFALSVCSDRVPSP